MAGKIFVTGDCHHDFRKFNMECFPEQRELDKDDYMIICGDFGGIWNVGWESKEEKYWLKWLDDKSYTTLFIDGNHENFDRLNGYPVKEWHGGKVHEIRRSVLHLMRGQVYAIAGSRIFAFGGASSHDVQGGVLDTEDPDFKEKKKLADAMWLPYRIKHLTWWEQELPNDSEYDEASKNLESADFNIDYIITHCCSTETQNLMASDGSYVSDALTDFFNVVKEQCEFKKWYFGHYHMDKDVSDKEVMLYDAIVPIGEEL
jgi:DNA repair exonuclease SbcCD nuclease subunit